MNKRWVDMYCDYKMPFVINIKEIFIRKHYNFDNSNKNEIYGLKSEIGILRHSPKL